MYYFYLHAGSENHGCEAIVRASEKLLGEPITLYSSNPEQDKKYHIDDIASVRKDKGKLIRRGSFMWILSVTQEKLLRRIDLAIGNLHRDLIDNVGEDDICFSIGGDNYCYGGTDAIAALNRNIKKKHAKTVLWGCSVEPDLLENPEIIKDIASFDLITARESISYNALAKVNNNTLLVADPAFLLERIDLPLPASWKQGKMIGINASPLIMNAAKNGEIAENNFHELIKYILNNTDFSIALIPHVVSDGNDDRIVLNRLKEAAGQMERIVMVPDCNCMELKGYIARCRLFIGARTHATIAAYSCGVPTLVLGYSVKSRGIARDIFGTEVNYVIPVQGLENEDTLINGFCWLRQNEEMIRNRLESFMPEYKERAFAAKKAIDDLINRGK